MKAKLIHILEMLAVIALGFVLVIFPGQTLKAAILILGIGLAVFGATAVLMHFVGHHETKPSVAGLILGIASLLGGILVLIFQDVVSDNFPLIASLITVIAGIAGIVFSFQERRTDPTWRSDLTVFTVTFLLGVVMFFFPFEDVTIVRVLGVILLYVGAARLIPEGK